MAYQMNNSLPSTDKETLSRIADMSVNYLRALKKTNDETYLEYLKNKKNKFNINEIILSLVKWNPDFRKTAFFRDKKTKDISKLKNEYFKQGRLLQEGDNLTVMGNPIALLMKAVGDNPLEENIFELESDAVQCYTARFKDNERLASFRSPHNSPNNILHFHNVYSDKLSKYFANLGRNVIVINMIGTDVQARASGMDEDTDFVYTTNQPDLAELARKAYTNYPSSGGSSSSTHKVTYDKNNNPNKPALKSNDYWTYEKLSKKGYSTSGQASSQISNYASKGANGFTQIGNKYFIVKWIANAGSPANASKAKNKLEKDHPKKIGKYGYAKRYHKGLELGKIEALPKIKPLIWCRI